MGMNNLQADTWPTMSATELQIHEPRRKTHGTRENNVKLQEQGPPSHPARALSEPPGALMKPPWPPGRLPIAYFP